MVTNCFFMNPMLAYFLPAFFIAALAFFFISISSYSFLAFYFSSSVISSGFLPDFSPTPYISIPFCLSPLGSAYFKSFYKLWSLSSVSSAFLQHLQVKQFLILVQQLTSSSSSSSSSPSVPIN